MGGAGLRQYLGPGPIQIGDSYVIYFVDHDQVSGRQCIGVATATKPEGSFHDENDARFVCQTDLGGSIDPYPFRDADGTLYLLWKNDGNCCGKPVSIWVQRLSADGMTLQGQPSELIKQDQAWEIPLVENPAVTANGGKYYLFYSANRWDSRDYAVGYAVCDTITGPCVKPLNGPILKATDEARGPGGESLLAAADGTLWMLTTRGRADTSDTRRADGRFASIRLPSLRTERRRSMARRPIPSRCHSRHRLRRGA